MSAGQGKEGNALKGQNTHMVTSSHMSWVNPMSWAEHITDLKRKLQFFLPLTLGHQKVGEGSPVLTVSFATHHPTLIGPRASPALRPHADPSLRLNPQVSILGWNKGANIYTCRKT